MYDKKENAQLSRRERVLLNPLEASQKSDSPFRKSNFQMVMVPR